MIMKTELFTLFMIMWPIIEKIMIFITIALIMQTLSVKTGEKPVNKTKEQTNDVGEKLLSFPQI